MIPEHILTKDEIRKINEAYGGYLRSDAEIETALYRGKGKSLFKKIACLWRAMLVGHPFTDGNKRTALVAALAMMERCDLGASDDVKSLLVSEIRNIAMKNITDVGLIERRLRYAIERH